MADNDSQIDIKKRARRRLVGSAALALTAAIVLPMVMDHEPRPQSQDVQIRIPSQEGSNFTSRVIGGKAPAPSQPQAGAAVDASAPVDADAAGSKTDPDVSAPLFKPGEELLPPPPKKLEGGKAESSPKSELVAKPDTKKAEPKPEPKLEAKPDPKAEAKLKAQAEADRAKALLGGANPKDLNEKPHLVLLGTYSKAENVANLRAKLKAEGYASYVEALGDKQRVRAGPFPNKAAAEKAAARISKVLGVAASVAAKP